MEKDFIILQYKSYQHCLEEQRLNIVVIFIISIFIITILFQQKRNMNFIKKYVKVKIFILPSKKIIILVLAPFIFAHPECLVEKIHGCKNNLEIPST